MSEAPEDKDQLGAVLHGHAKDPEVQELVEQAASQRHLTGAELDELRTTDAGSGDARIEAMRQHLLFCESCNAGYLGQELREDESLEPPTRGDYKRSGLRRKLAAAVLFVPLVGLGFVWPQGSDEDAAAAVDPVGLESLAQGEVLSMEWFGRGGGGPALERARDRLHAQFVMQDGVQEAHLYLFIVGQRDVVLLHPRPAHQAVNPIGAGLAPDEGWEIPGTGDRWRGVVGLASRKPHPMLVNRRDREQVAEELQIQVRAGAAPADLLRFFRVLPGSEDADLILAPVRSLD